MHKQMERLYQAAKELRGIEGQTEVANALAQSPQTVYNWENRGISKLGALKAQTAFGCSATWLLTGEGDMQINTRPTPEPGASAESITPSPFSRVRIGEEPDTIPVRRVRIKLRAGATGFETVVEPDDGGVYQMPREAIDTLGLVPHWLLATPVKGPSMQPMLFDGDLVVIDTQDIKPVSKELYAVNFNGESLIKQLVLRNNEWYLYSMNPDFGPVNVRSGQCDIVGRVVYQPGRALKGRL
ncbi:S24 family peptidase [Massilia sp. CFBP9026]|uniref:S24 family peptidase n=1 Tax=Massilia sp. CFBP9026 TaxID=3096536 RepID=UPI002A69C5FA|nr:S24 family peptidase [Massilia sp. CFBP9026]MDY0965407.1 S24 family peptidase [Massilia sp. CFBP9026]